MGLKKANHFLNPKRNSIRKSVSHSKREVSSARVATELTLDQLISEGVRVERPSFRNECPVERPCPFVGCRYHLYLDITDTGNIKYNFWPIEPWELKTSCALDVADLNSSGLLSLTDVGRYMGLTRERVRQIEKEGLEKLKAHTGNDHEWAEDNNE